MSAVPSLPPTCSDSQFKSIIEYIKSNSMLTDNQKAYYIETMQKQYAQVVIQNAITKVCVEGDKDHDFNVGYIDDEIILREKRKREE